MATFAVTRHMCVCVCLCIHPYNTEQKHMIIFNSCFWCGAINLIEGLRPTTVNLISTDKICENRNVMVRVLLTHIGNHLN